MTAALSPEAATEAARLDAVHRYDVLDSPPDRAFDRITALAARVFDVPVSLVSIVDSDRIWLKSAHGLDGVEEIPRAPGLCASVVLQEGPYVVTDAVHDPRTADNPLVCGEFGLRFYLGIPLRTPDGHNLGSLSVIDQQPRQVTDDDVATMLDLASVVVDELELRLAARRTIELQTALRSAAEDTARTLQEALLPPSLPTVPGLEVAARYRAEQGRVGGDFYDVVPTAGGAVAMVGDVCGKGSRAASFTATARWTLRTILSESTRPAVTLARLNALLSRTSRDRAQYCTVGLATVTADGAGWSVRTGLGGHPPALLVRPDGDVRKVGARGPIVGWREGFDYRDDVVAMAPGDCLVLYTDGLVDAVCGRTATTDDAVGALVARSPRGSAEALAAALDAAAATGDAADDVAVVVIRAGEPPR